MMAGGTVSKGGTGVRSDLPGVMECVERRGAGISTEEFTR
jgi:hypothetical protein